MTSYEQVVAAARAVRPADARLPYGDHPFAFGELRLPDGQRTRAPVVVFIHGGCWQAEYGVDHAAAAADGLAREGFAVWSPEYRRLGDSGGGWPGTFDDIAAAIAFVRTIAERHPEADPSRVVVVGHSAGGHLALWVAARPPLDLLGVVPLAAISDLAEYAAGAGSCNASVVPLLGGRPADLPERYREASPIERLPLGVPVAMVHGAADSIVPLAMSERYAARAREVGDPVELHALPGVGHFDLIHPASEAWAAVVAAVRRMAQAA